MAAAIATTRRASASRWSTTASNTYSSALLIPYAAAMAAAAGHPPADAGTDGSTPWSAASSAVSAADRASSASLISSTSPDSRARASPLMRVRLASTTCSDVGAAATSAPARRAPSSVPQTWCTSSRRRLTPSGHRLPSASATHSTVGRAGTASSPAAPTMRLRRWAGERSAAVQVTSTSTPRGARAFSAIASSRSTDLPNPGPAVITTARACQRVASSSTKRGRATRRHAIARMMRPTTHLIRDPLAVRRGSCGSIRAGRHGSNALGSAQRPHIDGKR
jgi:hypothetical protein